MLHVPKSFVGAMTAATLAIGLTACGGGGGGSLPAGGSSPTSPTQQTQPATAQMTINIPAKTSSINHRNPKYISVSTQSMTIGLVAGSKTTQLAEIDLTPSSPHCSALAGGGTQCNATFVGTAGTATYALSMYSGTGGTGNLLSTGNVQATLVAGQNTTVPLALDGVPSTVALVLGVATLPVGTASSTGVFVQAQDASGNIIVGPGGFSTAIGLAIAGDTYSTLTLSSTSVASPGQVVTLAYNGGTNVGSTITPSIGSAAGTAATFAGSGGSLTLFQYTDSAVPVGYSSYFDPEDVAAGPNGTGAALFESGIYTCCTTYLFSGDTIGTLSPTGVKTMFAGDTSDPFNPPAAGSLTLPGLTVVHGMSSNLNTETFESYDDLAVDANGLIYYSGSFETSSDTTNCSGGTEDSGTLGVLNPVAGTTKEYVLNGYPGPIKVDSAGNVWFMLYSGQCNGTYEIPTYYAIGELAAGASSVKETTFTTAGLATNGYPADMAITPDGSTMFFADCDNNTVAKIATASLSSPTVVTLTNSTEPQAIAVAGDGTTAWWSDNDPNDNYYYGYVPGSKTFSTANVAEGLFPINYFFSYTMSYADGSFWIGGEEYNTGIGRLSNVAAGSPVAGYYPMPAPDGDGQEVYSVSAGGGYVWGADDEYENIDVLQYGAPSNGTITYASRRIGTFSANRKPSSARHGFHAKGPHERTRAQ